MRAPKFFVCALVLAACSAQPSPFPARSNTGGSMTTMRGGATGSVDGQGQGGEVANTGGAAGSDASTTPTATGGNAGSTNTGGAMTNDAAPSPPSDDATTSDASAATDAPSTSPNTAGKTVLMVVGAGDIIGTDTQIVDVLKERQLKIETVTDAMAAAANAEGKSLVIMSYSLDSKFLKETFADAKVPLIVMEHSILDKLGMANVHKWAEPVTSINIIKKDTPLAAGFDMGMLQVYSTSGEMFWGTPSPAAINVATVPGKADQSVLFAYPAGAMMMTKPAPAKRLQFFFGAHQVPTKWMNDKGLKLLGAAIDWSLAP